MVEHMQTLELTQIGNSIGVVLPEELLTKLRVAEAVSAVVALADSTWSEVDFAAWLRLHSARVASRR